MGWAERLFPLLPKMYVPFTARDPTEIRGGAIKIALWRPEDSLPAVEEMYVDLAINELCGLIIGNRRLQ